MTIGNAYKNTRGEYESAIRPDIVKSMLFGPHIEAEGKTIYNGKFI